MMLLDQTRAYGKNSKKKNKNKNKKKIKKNDPQNIDMSKDKEDGQKRAHCDV